MVFDGAVVKQKSVVVVVVVVVNVKILISFKHNVFLILSYFARIPSQLTPSYSHVGLYFIAASSESSKSSCDQKQLCFRS